MADNVYKLKFKLSDNSEIDAGNITVPQGEKGDKGDPGTVVYSASTPLMDGTASTGTASAAARGDHRHPTDTSRQATLVSGTNIKTINGESLLGSGDITVSGGGSIDADTLIELLTGSNGINVAKNAAGDKVDVSISTEFSSTGMYIHIGNTIISLLSDGIMVGDNTDTYPRRTIIQGKGIKQDNLSFSQGQPTWSDYDYLHTGNTKTINGQSLLGSGDISAGGGSLYRHMIYITTLYGSTTAKQADLYIQWISSDNTQINTAAALFSKLAGQTFPGCGFIDTSGLGVVGAPIYYIQIKSTSTSSVIYYQDEGIATCKFSELDTYSITDTVTTV